MKLIDMQAVGFFSLGRVDVALNGIGVTLVEGINNDSPADSNGAGKSSIFEALLWCFYGVTRRGLKGDEVINIHRKGGAAVAVRFEVGDKIFTVVRSRKYGKLSTALLLFEGRAELEADKVAPLGAIEITKGTAPQTQEFIESIIGMGSITFQKAVFFGQGDIKPFASLTDGELKLVFEQSLGLEKISGDAAKVVGFRKGVLTNIERLKNSIKAEMEKLALVESQIESTSLIVEELKKEGFGRITSLNVERGNLKREVLNGEEACKELLARLASLKEGRDVLSGKISALESVGESLSLKTETIVKGIARLSEVKNSMASVSRNILSQAERVSSREGEECDTCGVLMDKEAVKTTLSRYNTMLGDATKKINESGSQLEELKEARARLSANEEQLRKNKTTLKNELETLRLEINEVEKEIANRSFQIAGCKERIFAIGKEIEEVSTSTMEEAKEALSKLLASRKEIGDLIDFSYKSLEDFESTNGAALELERALGNAGLKSLIFDQVTPDLNRHANYFLSLMEPGISVEISTVSKLKSGEMREKFSVNTSNEFGAASFAGNSGGEKQKVNLAIALAFNRLMREISGNVPDVIVLDEPFESLDAASSEQAVGLLKELTASNVFLITHNKEVRDLISNRIFIVKENGVSVFLDSPEK